MPETVALIKHGVVLGSILRVKEYDKYSCGSDKYKRLAVSITDPKTNTVLFYDAKGYGESYLVPGTQQYLHQAGLCAGISAEWFNTVHKGE